MFKKESIVVGDAEALARVLYVLERIAAREGITAFIDVKPILEREAETYELQPHIDRFRIWVPSRLYKKVIARVEKVDVIDLIISGEYPDVRVF